MHFPGNNYLLGSGVKMYQDFREQVDMFFISVFFSCNLIHDYFVKIQHCVDLLAGFVV